MHDYNPRSDRRSEGTYAAWTHIRELAGCFTTGTLETSWAPDGEADYTHKAQETDATRWQGPIHSVQALRAGRSHGVLGMRRAGLARAAIARRRDRPVGERQAG
jgi:hypothetical protein